MFKKTLLQGLAAQLVSLTIDVFAGLGLAFMRGSLEELPGMLIMVPAFLEMRGNIGGTLASRLGSGLHMGIIEPKLKMSKELSQNVMGSFALNVLESAVVGLLAHFMCVIFGFKSAGLLTLFLLALIAGVMSNVILMVITIVFAIKAYQKGLDPDIVMGPYVTTLGDLVSIPCLFLASLVLLSVGL